MFIVALLSRIESNDPSGQEQASMIRLRASLLLWKSATRKLDLASIDKDLPALIAFTLGTQTRGKVRTEPSSNPAL
jgi:hypothetical protein